jgi:hypothetical protein
VVPEANLLRRRQRPFCSGRLPYALIRARRLSRYSLELTFFNEFANGDPASLLTRSGWNDAVHAANGAQIGPPFSGYPRLRLCRRSNKLTRRIRQSHPDRLQDMSPTLRLLAEAETKKINLTHSAVVAVTPAPF